MKKKRNLSLLLPFFIFSVQFTTNARIYIRFYYCDYQMKSSDFEQQLIDKIVACVFALSVRRCGIRCYLIRSDQNQNRWSHLAMSILAKHPIYLFFHER